jgi:hypothetical protein
MPDRVSKALHQGFLSTYSKSNMLIISGEGGIGKFDLARQIAYHFRYLVRV